MNIALWILQFLFAVHTIMGALWKFSTTAEKSIPSLKAIPHVIWMSLSFIEIIVAILLVLPIVYKPAGFLVPFAAAFIVLEMLIYCGVHLSSSQGHILSPVIYWSVVAVICAFIAFGRWKLSPL